MREIPFKVIPLTNPLLLEVLKREGKPAGDVLDYKQKLLALLTFPAAGMGVSTPTLLKWIALGKKVADAEGSVLLEETEWQTLKERLDQEVWGFADTAFALFVDAVSNAPRVEVQKKE